MKSRHKFLIVLAAIFFAIYWLAVLAGGAGWNPSGISWDFERSGQFGDSFGPLGAVMSSVAAISALLAYWAQREELDRLKDAAEDERKRVLKRDFEDIFFRLLTMLRDVVKGIDVKKSGGDLYGSDAMSWIIINEMYLMYDEKTIISDRYK